MSLAVHLLGRPTIAGGRVAAPRGYKAWGLLTYLLATEVPPSRPQLAGLLFSEAADPLRSLRWHLFELRRVLGVPASNLGGDPVVLHLPAGTVVDITLVRSGESRAALGLPSLGRELLEGMDFSDSPAFEGWLLIERRHLSAVTESLLREAALSQLAAGNPETAVNLAGRLVQLEPLSEEHHALLQRSLKDATPRSYAPPAPALWPAPAPAARERAPERRDGERCPPRRRARPDQRLARSEIAALEPSLQDVPERAVYTPTDGGVDPVAMTEALVRAARTLGTRVVQGSVVTSLAVAGGRVNGVMSSTGFHRAFDRCARRWHRDPGVLRAAGNHPARGGVPQLPDACRSAAGDGQDHRGRSRSRSAGSP